LVFKIFFSNFASLFNILLPLYVRKVYGLLIVLMTLCVSCEWQLKPNSHAGDDKTVTIERYDRIESLYLTTGDYSALQQMNTSYPMQTRMLIEDMLRIGKVDDPEINTKFLRFFQDPILQTLLDDVQRQYGDMNDLNEGLTTAFSRLKEELPDMEVPQFYAQIGSFDQSIIVNHNILGISLDKYLGSDYPFYKDNYPEEQRRLMVRDMIIPDCLSFYILSLYPLAHYKEASQSERNHHMGKIQWVVNQIMGHQVFKNDMVAQIEQLMKRHGQVSIEELLSTKKF